MESTSSYLTLHQMPAECEPSRKLRRLPNTAVRPLSFSRFATVALATLTAAVGGVIAMASEEQSLEAAAGAQQLEPATGFQLLDPTTGASYWSPAAGACDWNSCWSELLHSNSATVA